MKSADDKEARHAEARDAQPTLLEAAEALVSFVGSPSQRWTEDIYNNLRAAVERDLPQLLGAGLAKDAAYAERDRLVAALTKVFPAHMTRHPESDADWDDDWRWIVVVELPTGQATWHIHDSERDWFTHLEEGPNTWDGHTTDEKYRRIAALTKGDSESPGAPITADELEAVATDAKASEPEQGDGGDEIEAWRQEVLHAYDHEGIGDDFWLVDEDHINKAVKIMRRLEQERDEARGEIGVFQAVNHDLRGERDRIRNKLADAEKECAERTQESAGWCLRAYAAEAEVRALGVHGAEPTDEERVLLRAAKEKVEKRATELDSALTSQGILLDSVTQDRAQVEADRDALKGDLAEALALLRWNGVGCKATYVTRWLSHRALWREKRAALLARCKERE